MLDLRDRMESIRRTIRDLIGAKSLLYQSGANVLDFFSIVFKEGLGTWINLMQLKNYHTISQSLVPVSLHNIKYPIFIRPGSIDVKTIIDTVIREEYGQFQPASEPKIMIDAGAYIGDTSAYFLSRFPYLKVFALEPHTNNYEIARKNLSPYCERVVLLNKGLWVKDQKLYFGGDFSKASIRDTGYEIDCISLPTILEQFSIPRKNILKMDIEGAEEAIFSTNPEKWLDRIDLLIIEIHGKRINEVVTNALKNNHFSMKNFRSIYYCSPN